MAKKKKEVDEAADIPLIVVDKKTKSAKVIKSAKKKKREKAKAKLQIKRGNKANLPQLADGELAFVKDEERVYVGKDGDKNIPMANFTELSEITQEIKEARSDYFGKEYPNLKAKEDAEYERVHIDNSKGMYMPTSSNTGVIKVENSIEGKTKDLKVDGRTLQNLWVRDRVFSFEKTQTIQSELKESSDKSITVDLKEAVTSNRYAYFSAGRVSNFFKMLKPNTVYTVLCESKGVDSVSLCQADSLNSITSRSTKISDNAFRFSTIDSLNLTNQVVYFGINKQIVGEVYVKNVVIMEGDHTANPPTTYFEGLKSVGEEENKISILSTGKNLFNTGFENGAWSNDNGNAMNIANYCRCRNHIDVKPNFNYFISNKYGTFPQIQFRRKDGSFISSKTNVNNYFTTPSYCYKVTFNYTSKTVAELDSGNTQLEEGITATPYAPPQQDKKDILLPVGVTHGSKGIGNVCDEGYWNGDYLQKVDKYTFTGNEVIRRNTTYGDVTRFDIDISLIKAGYGVSLMSNIFPTGAVSTPNLECINVHAVSRMLQVQIKTSKADTVEAFKTFITGKELVYELAEPILHKATTPVNNNLATFKDITHISCLNKIAPSEISAKFPVEVGGTLSRLTSENKTLENENIKLNKRLISKAIYFNEQTVDLATVDFETDFRLMEIEFALEIPINLNMKGMKNMAVRSPYDMAKIVILGGNYERADMEYKLSVYVKRGRMTQEEHDELIALMDAREIVQK